MKMIIKKIINKLGFEVRRKKGVNSIVVTRSTSGKSRGNVLLSYIIEPFLPDSENNISRSHTHFLESVLIVETFLDLGFNVDIIDYRDSKFIPKKDYSFFVSARTNFQRIASHLKKNCIKIVHLDTAHWLFNNYASYSRLHALKERKRVVLYNRKWVEKNWAIEHADYAIILGNDFTVATYSYEKKDIYRLPIPTHTEYNSPKGKNFKECKNTFLWFGSTGFVHKGLDLVLETFKKAKELKLYVCGPIDAEKDFEYLYEEELYRTSNIEMLGWVDINSELFLRTISKCIGIIYPSCSEGQSGAVVTCQKAGLIPIVSYESGVDVHDFGIILNSCSIEDIGDALRQIVSSPEEKLKSMSFKAWQHARNNYTKDVYTNKFNAIIQDIIKREAVKI